MLPTVRPLVARAVGGGTPRTVRIRSLSSSDAAYAERLADRIGSNLAAIHE